MLINNPPVQKFGLKKRKLFALLAFGPFEASRGMQILRDWAVLDPANVR